MRIKIICILLSLLYITACNHQDIEPVAWDVALSAEENITRNAIVIPDNTQWDFLKEIVKDKSIVVLGEQMHFDLTSTSVRADLLRKLHDCGFTTIIFEMTPMLSGYAASHLQPASQTDWEALFYYTPWIMHKESFEPILKMLETGYFKGFGMDCDIAGSDFTIARTILESYSQPNHRGINWGRMHYLTYKLSGLPHDAELMTTEEQFEYIAMMNDLKNRVDYLIDKYGLTTDLSALKQWLRNMDRNFFDFSSRLKYRVFGGLLGAMRVQIRDKAMVENVLWYRKHFPDEKLIIWCANLHAAKDLSLIKDRELDNYYYNTLTENLCLELGDEVYSIAITSLNRSDSFQAGEFERQIARFTDNAPYAFIDFEALRWLDGYRTAEFEFPMINELKKGQWLNIFDGIYYIRDIKCMQFPKEEPENLKKSRDN